MTTTASTGGGLVGRAAPISFSKSLNVDNDNDKHVVDATSGDVRMDEERRALDESNKIMTEKSSGHARRTAHAPRTTSDNISHVTGISLLHNGGHVATVTEYTAAQAEPEVELGKVSVTGAVLGTSGESG